MKPRGWGKFQHYKDRRPPWIKLHRDLLENEDYAMLDPVAAKYLPLIWLIASEHENGELPESKRLAFRLRISFTQLSQILTNLSEWFEQDASTPLADCKQVATPETETEGERDTETKEKEPPEATPLDNKMRRTDAGTSAGATPRPNVELPDWLDADAWAGFVEMRKKIKKPLTDRAIKGIFSELGRINARGQDPNACLDRSTMNCWKGVFELKTTAVFPVAPKPRTQYEIDRDEQQAELRAARAGVQ